MDEFYVMLHAITPGHGQSAVPVPFVVHIVRHASAVIPVCLCNPFTTEAIHRGRAARCIEFPFMAWPESWS